MSIEDTGVYTRAGFVGSDFRDFVVWPPGWKPPSVTETVILGASLSIPTNGITVAGYTNSSGELWNAYNLLPFSRRIGFISSVYAGVNYSAGDSVQITRIPRFPVPHRPIRGTPPGLFFPNLTQDYPGLVKYPNTRARFSNIAYIGFATAHSFAVGHTVVITGFSDLSFNGTFVISSVTTTGITYILNGLDSSGVSESGTVVMEPWDFVRRLHQFGGLKPWIRVTGPSVPTSFTVGSGSPTQAPYDSAKWFRNGVELRMVTLMGTPFQIGCQSTYFKNTIRVWAPAVAEETPDFSVDATLPTYGIVRVVWVSGNPTLHFPSDGVTPPYAGATRLGRRRTMIDAIGIMPGTGAATGIRIAEGGGRVESLFSLATPQNTWPLGPSFAGAVRASLFGTMHVGYQMAFFSSPTTFSSITAQWYRQRAGGTDLALGSPFSIGYLLDTTTSPPNTVIWANDSTIPPPNDPSWGDAPAGYYLSVVTTTINASVSTSLIIKFFSQGNANSGASMRPTSIFPKLIPWPFDVPRFPFAADDTDVRYVANAGWRLKSEPLPTISVTAPTISRSGTTITSVIGSLSVTPSSDASIPTIRDCVLRAISKNANSGGITGSNATSVNITQTNSAFFGQTVDAEAVDCWTINASHTALTGLSEYAVGVTVSALP